MPPAGTITAAPRREGRNGGTGARSGARRTSTKPSRHPLRIRWERMGRVLLVIVLAVVGALYVQQGLAYLSVRSQTNHQKAIVLRLVRQNAQLAQQEKALNNPATIERYARELGMIKPGERPYVVTGLPAG